MKLEHWLTEMKRRRVFRALLGYGIVAFAVLQIIEPIMHGLNLPEWVLKATVVALGLGFPFTLVLAWAFDVKGGRIEIAGAPRGRWLLVLLGLGLAVGAPGVGWYFWQSHHPPGATDGGSPSIAVLPFADLSPGKDQDWMCDGIAEEILDALCTVSGLRVAARSSSFQFKGKSADAHQMALALGVSTLLEGSVRKVGDRLRVSARLVSAEGYELWSDKFDRGVSDAFAIQEEIARSVVAALRLRTEHESHVGTVNAEAYEMYLRGRQYLHASSLENFEHSRQMFKRAIALDKGFAKPHAGLAETDVYMVQWLLVSPKEAPAIRAEALASSEEALRLDPNLAEAYEGRAGVLALLGRNAEADQSYQRAISLGPGVRDVWYFYGRFLFAQHRYVEAAHAFEAAAKLNPDDYDSLSLATMPYRKLGEGGKVIEFNRLSLAAAERVLKSNPADVRALYMSAQMLIVVGEKDKGRERLAQAVALRPYDFSVLYNGACGYARAGDLDAAIELLDRAVGTGQGFRAWLEQDPDLDPLRTLPRFRQILARLPADAPAQ